MTAAVRSLVVGSVVEVVVFFFSIPKNSTQPETGFQLVAAYTQAPGMFGFFRFGELIGKLPAGIAIPLELLNLAAAFLIEAGLFALPFWLSHVGGIDVQSSPIAQDDRHLENA